MEMSERMMRALGRLEERAMAAAGQDPDDQRVFHEFEDQFLTEAPRKLLSGYVDTDDMESAIHFVVTMRMAVALSIQKNDTMAAAELGIDFVIAQAFLAGQLYERDRASTRPESR